MSLKNPYLNPKKRPGALMRLYAAVDVLEVRIDSNINDVRRTQRNHLHGALENMRFELDTIGHQMNAAAGANATSTQEPSLTGRQMFAEIRKQTDALRESLAAEKKIRDSQPRIESGDRKTVWDLACAMAISGNCPPEMAVHAAATMRLDLIRLFSDLDPTLPDGGA